MRSVIKFNPMLVCDLKHVSFLLHIDGFVQSILRHRDINIHEI